MNKKVIFATVGIVLIIGAALAYVLFTAPKQSASDELNSTVVDDETSTVSETPAAQTPVAQTPAPEQPGVYTTYAESKLSSTAGTKLLFFHAPWCPQCRDTEKSINDGGLPSGVTVFKVDYDSNQALRQKYGVTLQTTFVKIDDSGNKVASYVAYQEPRFSSVERELLK